MSEVYSARTHRYDDTASMYSMNSSIVVRRQCIGGIINNGVGSAYVSQQAEG